MEHPQNPAQAQAPNQFPKDSPDHSLRSYFLQQGQSIINLHDLLRSNAFAYGLKAFFSVVLQLVCYALFALAIYFCIALPNDLPGIFEMLNKPLVAKVSPNIPEFSEFMVGLKILIAVIALPVLICAFLLGRNRRKSARIRKSFNEVELMKQNFDRAVKDFKF